MLGTAAAATIFLRRRPDVFRPPTRRFFDIFVFPVLRDREEDMDLDRLDMDFDRPCLDPLLPEDSLKSSIRMRPE
jgi:hypothetical protein